MHAYFRPKRSANVNNNSVNEPKVTNQKDSEVGVSRESGRKVSGQIMEMLRTWAMGHVFGCLAWRISYLHKMKS